MPARPATAAAVATVCLVAAGCSGGGADPAGSPGRHTPRPPAPTREVRNLVLPLDAYTLDGPQVARIVVAQDRLIGSCMARRGFHWPRLPDRGAESWPNRGRYGLIEPEPAKRYGYHPLPDPRSEAAEAWITRREGGLTPKERAAAYGKDGTSGCEKRAERELLRNVPKVDFGRLDRIAEGAYERSRRHPDVTKAFARWSACMRAKGFRYPDPMTANNDPRWKGESPSGTEIATARSDVACKHRTSVVRIWWRTEAELQKRQIRRHATWFARIRVARARYLANVDAHDNA
ncbi:hypothetical protein HUT19_34930 [Streptomyces sp. NA02950]|uniref:hypothetical protein n=1 Tax=Streptomyces sp. NA02950 TaxID=2742137 RepID=UPI001590C9EE|nr:hypothetical protein [Streptomyces sp. NA02950]QKV96277.1 hypothetical protein HUT19_34930 [Streptomyces sp. NA02950]